MKISEPYSFQFYAYELPRKFSQILQESKTGYWRFEFSELAGSKAGSRWYLGLSQGKIVFSGNQPCCWSTLFETLQRYIIRLRDDDAKQEILRVEEQLTFAQTASQAAALLTLLTGLNELNVLTIEEIRESLRLKALSDFDMYFFKYAGRAHFLPYSQMESQLPFLGFDIEVFLSQANERRLLWQTLKTVIPSMEMVPTLNHRSVKASTLSGAQRQQLESLVSNGRTLDEIADFLAQDALDIARLFAKLISDNLVTLRASSMTETTEVFVVDDSKILLKQFESLVASWGYCVRSFSEPPLALQALVDANPAVIFLDINMPNVTGFDLVKQIRRLPGLEEVPIIMLTAEKSLSNNWRARWSGCQFMSKPLASSEIPTFRLELRALLNELAPLHQPAQPMRQRAKLQMETSY
ncbi:MAG: response regulator [Stenomitos rutilans HA7619-LM2]|jgi:CheY-like chemotaxis protein|nr:response regulator [Stenomitos rutilans HA7619-LM2]